MSTFRFLFLLSAIFELTEGCRRCKEKPRCVTVPRPRPTSPPRLPWLREGRTRGPPVMQSTKGAKRTATPKPPWMQTKMTRYPPTAWANTKVTKALTTTKSAPPWMQTKPKKGSPEMTPSPSWRQPEVTKRPPTTKPSSSWIQPEVIKPHTTRSTSSSITTNVPMATGRIKTSPGQVPLSKTPTVQLSTTESTANVQSTTLQGEAKSPGSRDDDSTGESSEGGGSDDGTQLPPCRGSAATTVLCIPRKTTAILEGSPLMPPPQTAPYFHWMVEAFLVLLVVVISICLVTKTRNSGMCCSVTEESDPERLHVSGTTSYEEIGNINRSRRSDSTVTPEPRQSPVVICEQGVQPELATVAGNLYENAREISRPPRNNGLHTYENIDAILYEDMRRQIDLQVDHDYEKLQRSCSTSSQSPGSCGGFYNSLVEVDAKQTPDVTTASGGLKHSVTTDLERFADCSDESGGHM